MRLLPLLAVGVLAGACDPLSTDAPAVLLATVGDVPDDTVMDGTLGLAVWNEVEACVTMTWDRHAVLTEDAGVVELAAVYVRSPDALEDGTDTPAEGVVGWAPFGAVDGARPMAAPAALSGTWRVPETGTFDAFAFHVIEDGCPKGVARQAAGADLQVVSDGW
ncbi:MAG: hypothetical protein H6733_02495 [Alphaproteobacteria bacterium]|nr:hypothetical protein [Alphaproteobacteria bacterium]